LDTEISYGRSFKTFPLVADDYFAVSIPNASSMAGADQESELDVSCVSNDELGKTLPDRYKPSADMSKAAEVTGTGEYHNLILFENFLMFIYSFLI
jgi:hypothetical protein